MIISMGYKPMKVVWAFYTDKFGSNARIFCTSDKEIWFSDHRQDEEVVIELSVKINPKKFRWDDVTRNENGEYLYKGNAMK